MKLMIILDVYCLVVKESPAPTLDHYHSSSNQGGVDEQEHDAPQQRVVNGHENDNT